MSRTEIQACESGAPVRSSFGAFEASRRIITARHQIGNSISASARARRALAACASPDSRRWAAARRPTPEVKAPVSTGKEEAILREDMMRRLGHGVATWGILPGGACNICAWAGSACTACAEQLGRGAHAGGDTPERPELRTGLRRGDARATAGRLAHAARQL
jgi:hypothetical protein